ncbi:DUF1850 domain-containing protein [Brevibacillus sp. SYP-B805]|uniref:DUF1850 domain-containing protein n=1 Tax=Brevibacillus sp. SYP-B805 TaxID=1578199 RepID=UPI0013EC171C|nr:DUF1850 domain-containing protein [Brevibacillus sp. SYP-B805]NGQ95705.1 DUF1850 domain-containing protein [Brevibacillus sp. SYP-B805]
MIKYRLPLFLLFVGLILTGPHPFFLLRDFHTHRTVAAVPVWPGDRFSVEWTHSVELTPWRETYEVAWPDGIRLIETAFRSFGAGVPTVFEHAKVRVQGGWVVVTGLDDRRDEVVYLISRDDYKLTVGAQTWRLPDLVPLDTSLEMSVAWRPWWYRVLFRPDGKDVKAVES